MIAIWVSSALAATCTVVLGASVTTPASVVTEPVVVADGRVVAVGAGPDLVLGDASARWKGDACRTVQAPEGARLTAGLVAVPTQLGLVEVSLEPSSRDDEPRDTDPIHAAHHAADGYAPTSTLIPIERREGVTSAVTVPGGGWVSGVGAFVRLSGDTQAASLVDRDTVMVAHVPGGAFGDGLVQLSELLDDARVLARDPGSWDRGRPFTPGASRSDLEALAPVARGELPLLLDVDAAHDLEAVLRWKAEEKVRLVISGAAEGWRVADALAAAGVPVLVQPLVIGPGSFDQLGARADNAALLAAAGVDVVIAVEGTHQARTLRYLAGNAVRGGLSPEAALRSITEVPARVFGQPDRGVIRPGAVADLVLWSGDPFELATRALEVWIGGEPVDLRTRQTALFEKYRELPGTPVEPLSLP